MIITCVNCYKKFEVNAELIPENGRKIQCGSCNHVWFFKKNDKKIDDEFTKQKADDIFRKIDNISIKTKASKNVEQKKAIIQTNKDNTKLKKTALIKYQKKQTFSFNMFLSYIIVFIISFIALIILLDTFKVFIIRFFPNIENFLFSFYEVLKDIK